MSEQKTTKKAHQRSYDTPIKLIKGDQVSITKQDKWDDEYLWLWCVHFSCGEGWVPATLIARDGDTGIVTRNYDAIELTVAAGEPLIIYEQQSGWYWCENEKGHEGWVPVSCF